ncbi:MAG: hypothetical protein PHP62_01065 [Candidatus Moranbacteria bacterium]|nr:hypothetical protein [Candidatus Moranbacteria bacterium]
MSTGTFLDGEEQRDITLKKGRLHLPDGKPIPVAERCYTSTPTTGKKKAPKGHNKKAKSINAVPKTSLPKTRLGEKTTLPKTTLFPKTPLK